MKIPLKSPSNSSVFHRFSRNKKLTHLSRCVVYSVGLFCFFASEVSQAQVTGFELLGTEAPAFKGRLFGAAGTARKLTGKARLAVDPADPRNAVIADIELAPKDNNGRITATADVLILQPQHPNGTLLIEVPNRGRKLMGPVIDNAPDTYARLSEPDDAGLGFLLSQGYTLAWIGWQGDLGDKQGRKPNVLGLDTPILEGVTGPSRDEWVFPAADSKKERIVKLSYPAASHEGATLTVRDHLEGARTRSNNVKFHFEDDDTLKIFLPKNQSSEAIYEFNYIAKFPKVMGLGFAALRDVAYFLRHDESPNNPLAIDGKPQIRFLLGVGVSQSARVLRDFVYLGFNEGEDRHSVYDGLLLQVPGGRRSFTNFRFAQPARNPGPNSDHLYPVDQFPMAYATSTDVHTGRTDGILRSCLATHTCPKIMQVDSEYEFWASHASQSVTDTQGKDLPLPRDVRAYFVAGMQHYVSADGHAEFKQGCQLKTTPVYAGPLMRSLLTDLNEWVSMGTEPPASRYPSVSDGTLVRPDDSRLYQGLPALGYQGYAVPSWRTEGAAGLPKIRGAYPVLVPLTDSDGLALGGLRIPAVAVPRATYIGWNAKSNSQFKGICTQLGGVLPFAETRKQRLAQKDRRPSIEERYPSRDSYTAAVRAAAWRLERDRLMLSSDAIAATREAEAGTLDRLK